MFESRYPVVPMDILKSPSLFSFLVSRFQNIFTSRDSQEFFSLLNDNGRDWFVDHSHGRVAKQLNEAVKGNYSWCKPILEIQSEI
jgi:hypothetical protein